MCIDGNILNYAILLPSIEKLSIISADENKEIPDISLDTITYKNIKTLECTGFIPDSRLLKPSIGNLTIHANNQKLENLTEINMGNYKYVDLQLSGSDLSKINRFLEAHGGDKIGNIPFLSATSQSNPPRTWNVRFILPLPAEI